MKIILAAVTAAVFSWVGNKLLTRVWKAEGIIFLTPFVEEVAKSFTAIAMNQPVILVHGAFGLIEALYDMTFAHKNGPPAALASLFGHLLYGVITNVVLRIGGIIPGILMAYGAHSLWNAFVIKMLAGSRKTN